MKCILWTLSAVALLLMSGCAFSNSKLELQYGESIAKTGPLSSADPVRIKIEPLHDSRGVVDRIGDKKNGFGMDCADVVTTKPVPELVRESLAVLLQKNGHIISDEQPDLIVTGTVETFWFESQVNFWTIEFTGIADINLELKDASTSAVLLNKKYSGHHNEQFYTALDKEVQGVMNRALEDLMNNICMDTKLVETLRPYSKAMQASLPAQQGT